MARPCNHETPSPAVSAGIVLGMLAMAIIPAAIALHSVKTPASLSVAPSASPHGYTWSLLLFIVPIVGIAFWFLPGEGLDIPQRLQADNRHPRADRLPARRRLRGVVFSVSQSAGNAWNPCSCPGPAGPD
jgi:hypothetical protein